MEPVVRFVLIHRRVVAATLAALAVWSAITAITHTPDSRSVLVATRDLASGTSLTADDFHVRHVPEGAVPDGTVTAGHVTGRALAGAMRAGEIFTDRRVVDPRELGAGRVLAVVEVSAATGELLRVGDAVDLLAISEDTTTVTVATAVEVVTIRADADRDTAVLGVAVKPALAAELARVSVTSRLAAVVVARM